MSIPQFEVIPPFYSLQTDVKQTLIIKNFFIAGTTHSMLEGHGEKQFGIFLDVANNIKFTARELTDHLLSTSYQARKGFHVSYNTSFMQFRFGLDTSVLVLTPSLKTHILMETTDVLFPSQRINHRLNQKDMKSLFI